MVFHAGPHPAYHTHLLDRYPGLGINYFATAGFTTGYSEPDHVLASLMLLSQLLGYQAPFVDPGWTLEYEMLFYGLFALSLAVVKSEWLVYPALFLLWLTLGIDLIVFGFIMGMLVGRWYSRENPVARPELLALVGGVVFIGPFLLGVDMHGWSRGDQLMFWGLPSMLIVAGLSRMRQLKRGASTFLGDASCSIYIVHWSAIRVFNTLMERLGFVFDNPDVYIAVCSVFCISSGSLVHKLIERPIARRFKAPHRRLKAQID